MLRTVSVFVAVSILLLVTESASVQMLLGNQPRFTTDFSPSRLQSRLTEISRTRPDAVFLGDSVLWGFRESPRDIATSILQSRGCSCVNLAFKSGGPPNEYVLAKLIAKASGHPKMVVLEVNQRTTNRKDASYRSLVPAVSQLGRPLLSPTDLGTLDVAPPESAFGGTLLNLFPVYAMRSDIKETIVGDDDSSPVKDPVAPNPDDFEGTYDITPLTSRNLGVQYLAEATAVLQHAGISVLAFTTPTNHDLLHEYIDDPTYASNDAFLAAVARKNGAIVLDLDKSFPASAFIDNDHLNEAGQMLLANALQASLHMHSRSK